MVLHIGAVLFYLIRRNDNLIKPMVGADTLLDRDAPQSRDTGETRLLALVVLVVCSGLIRWPVSLGG